MACGNRDFVVTVNKDCPFCSELSKCGFCDQCHHVRVRSNSELWHKENLINLGVSYLPDNWNYMAWVDADIIFSNSSWAEDTIAALQHYHIVQMFQNATDLGPKGEFLKNFDGFVYKYSTDNQLKSLKYAKLDGHPGYCYATTKYGWNSIGGLFDVGILGSGDRIMLYCWLGIYESSIPKGSHHNYITYVKSYQDRCQKAINYSIGYVKGTILHEFHGKKKDRQYDKRWQILVKNNYDPIADIKKNNYGVWEFVGNKHLLIAEIKKYFSERNEDSIDL